MSDTLDILIRGFFIILIGAISISIATIIVWIVGETVDHFTIF